MPSSPNRFAAAIKSATGIQGDRRFNRIFNVGEGGGERVPPLVERKPEQAAAAIDQGIERVPAPSVC
jgi:hypothetical protein